MVLEPKDEQIRVTSREGQGRIRRLRRFAKPHQQPVQVRSIDRGDGIDFHAQAAAGGGVFDDGLGANLPLLDQEVQVQEFALALARARFYEQARRT